MTSVMPPSSPPATAPAPATNQPSGGASRSTGRTFVTVFAALTIIITVFAVVLAALAPELTAGTGPNVTGLTKVYDADLHDSAANFDLSRGCSETADGLHAATDSSCAFLPSANNDLISNGILITVEIAPAGQLPGLEEAYIQLGNDIYAVVGQDGSYLICYGSCNANNGASLSGTSDTWHASGYSSNTLSLGIPSDSSEIQVFTNGQPVGNIVLPNAPGTLPIFIGAPRDGEALFTHITIYSGNSASIS